MSDTITISGKKMGELADLASLVGKPLMEAIIEQAVRTFGTDQLEMVYDQEFMQWKITLKRNVVFIPAPDQQ